MEIQDQKKLLGIVAFEMFMVAALCVATIALIQRVHHQTGPLFNHLKSLAQQSFNLSSLDGRKIRFYLSLSSAAVGLSALAIGSALAVKSLFLKRSTKDIKITIEYSDGEKEVLCWDPTQSYYFRSSEEESKKSDSENDS